MAAFNHDQVVQALALRIERAPRYALVKYFVPWGDAKTDLVGSFYPDVTCLRREGKTKLMIEVLTPYSFEDTDEVRRLEGLSSYCAANQWEYYLACADEGTKKLTLQKIEGRPIRPKAVWVTSDVPFTDLVSVQ